MGWRIAGTILALWAFNVAMHQPIFALCIGLIAGWLFGLGRRVKAVGASPQSASPIQTPPPPLVKNASGSSNGLSAADVQINSERGSGSPPKPSDSGHATKAFMLPPAAAQQVPAEEHAVAGLELGMEQPTIVTRTSPRESGTELADPYELTEKRWTRAEQLQLLDLYEQGKPVSSIARAMRVDQKQVAIKLIRLLLVPSGNIENSVDCPRHGKQYTNEELRVMENLHSQRMRLRVIANELQRTQLGVGWRLLDLHLPQVPANLRGGLRSDDG